MKYFYTHTILLVSMLCAVFNTRASDAVNTYHGVPLTVETIMNFVSPPPAQITSKLDLLIQTESKFRKPITAENQREGTRQLLKIHLHNQSLHNYVFLLRSDEQYFIKITGPNCKQRGKKIRQQYSFEPYPTTFFVFSRLAHYLRFCEAIEQFNLTYIHAPKTYIYHIPGKPEYLCDDNYFLIQERLGTDWRRVQHKCEWLTPVAAQQLKTALAYAHLSDIIDNVLINEDGHLMYIDFEHDVTGVHPYMPNDPELLDTWVAFGAQRIDKLLTTSSS